MDGSNRNCWFATKRISMINQIFSYCPFVYYMRCEYLTHTPTTTYKPQRLVNLVFSVTPQHMLQCDLEVLLQPPAVRVAVTVQELVVYAHHHQRDVQPGITCAVCAGLGEIDSTGTTTLANRFEFHSNSKWRGDFIFG